VAWPSDSRSPAVAAFVRAAQAVAGSFVPPPHITGAARGPGN
jgi:hypothetical protein